MTNGELVNRMYENFLDVANDDPKIKNKEDFAGRAMQTMLNFAYDLLDDIASGKKSAESWRNMKAGIILNNS